MDANTVKKERKIPEKVTDKKTDDLAARKARKEELRKQRLKRASFFWLVIGAYFVFLILLAFFIFKATGLFNKIDELEKGNLVASRERAARGVIQNTPKKEPEPVSEQTEVVDPPTPNVVILEDRGVMEGIFYRIIGRVQNVGTAPALNVKVHATFFDAEGNVVGRDTDHVWRQVNALQPNQKFGFKNTLSNTQSNKVASYKLVVRWY